MSKTCSAIAKSTEKGCKNRSLPGSHYCVWHIEKPPLMIGALLGAAAGFFSTWILPTPELVELRRLRTDVAPLVALAQSTFPELDRNQAVAELARDVDELRTKVAKHEFTPLEPELWAAALAQLRPIAELFASRNMRISVTHETWTPTATRQYANELVELLADAGFAVSGPEQITYFLVTPSAPIEWGYNETDTRAVEALYQGLMTIIRRNPKWTQARHQEAGSVRIHFGGEVKFEPTGIVSVD